jgi:L-amino acid N-acyltransferase YncA
MSIAEDYDIREAIFEDLSEITTIYNYYVLKIGDVTTFEEEPVTLTEMKSRFDRITSDMHFPFLVVVEKTSGKIAGYAYAQPYKPRAAYRFSAEDSIYLHPDYTGKNIGTALLRNLLVQLRTKGIKQVVAVLGTQKDNPASYHMHAKLGFKEVAHYPKIGWKYEQWVDRVHMQAEIAPTEAEGHFLEMDFSGY